MGVQLDLATGTLRGPFLDHGRTYESATVLQTLTIPPHGLRSADTGFFHWQVLADLSADHLFWRSRGRAGTSMSASQGPRIHLPDWLASVGTCVDQPSRVGPGQQLAPRVLAVRMPQAVVDHRRRRLRAEAQRRGQPLSAERLALAAWTIFSTNAPVEQLSVDEARVRARARWQIELLFKRWKSHGKIDEWRSSTPWRGLCEVSANLIAMVIQHWIILVGTWTYADCSLPKAARTIRAHARHLASVLHHRAHLELALTTIVHGLRAGCRMNPRKTGPNTYQLLCNATLNQT